MSDFLEILEAQKKIRRRKENKNEYIVGCKYSIEINP